MSKFKLFLLILGIVLIIAGAVIIVAATRVKKIDGPALINGFGDGEGSQVVLVDYCWKRVGTVGNDGYTRTVLYQNRDGSCEVHIYSKYGDDGVEEHSAYKAEQSVVEDAYKIINDNKINRWPDKYNSIGPDGSATILRFRDSDGEYILVNTGCMPDDGENIMDSVDICLRQHTYEQIELK